MRWLRRPSVDSSHLYAHLRLTSVYNADLVLWISHLTNYQDGSLKEPFEAAAFLATQALLNNQQSVRTWNIYVDEGVGTHIPTISRLSKASPSLSCCSVISRYTFHLQYTPFGSQHGRSRLALLR